MVTVRNLVENFNLEILVQGDNQKEIQACDINRPGLQLAGYYEDFDNNRLQILGKTEYGYFKSLPEEIRKERIENFFSLDVPCIIITRSLNIDSELIEAAKKKNIWMLRTSMNATKFIGKITNYLELELAPETRLHGVLVDVYGIGILITGESGIGKSETALELIKRGHRLVADDAVDIKQVDGILHGTCPYVTKGMLEVRGMGIIDISAVYGLSAIIPKKIVKMVISIENWDADKYYERLGIDKEEIEILNVKVPKVTLPIRPGRNLAVIIEAAAVNFRYTVTQKITAVDTIEKRINELNNIEK
ncbi:MULTISPECIES: HPr(Ser) kinase/phosphatase [Clostridium]|uniref:HPr kinase/phosphorylase n=1 Tax=Clostridium senegalense TaxID=1465809 RepID=A0A6M0H2J6_9CLOT|nr:MULTISPECIES: HPr(Ser) kinase/phosphatase [Clostridium]NEU04945.1 HPr kinase/phosphorylase [Clostridium senegalense]